MRPEIYTTHHNDIHTRHTKRGERHRRRHLSLPQLFDAHVFFRVLLHDFGDCEFEVFLRDVDAALAQGVHPRLRADALHFRPGGARQLLGDDAQVDSPCQIHFPRMNFQNVRAGVCRDDVDHKKRSRATFSNRPRLPLPLCVTVSVSQCAPVYACAPVCACVPQYVRACPSVCA